MKAEKPDSGKKSKTRFRELRLYTQTEIKSILETALAEKENEMRRMQRLIDGQLTMMGKKDHAIAEKCKEIEMLKIGAKHMEDEIASLKSDKEYFINQNRLNSLEVIRLKKELDSRRTA